MSPPDCLAVLPLALAAHDFWRAARGAREALGTGDLTIATHQLATLAVNAPHWPAPIRTRAEDRVLALYPELHGSFTGTAPQ